MKCLKCQNDVFDKSAILAKISDIEPKHSYNECKFEVLTCKKCHLTQWYDYAVISGEKKTEQKHGRSFYELPKLSDFICLDCHSHTCVINTMEPITEVLFWEGKILSRTCTKCGLAEFYQVMLVATGRGRVIWLKQKAELAKSFNCVICTAQKVKETGQIEFTKIISQPKYSSKQSMEFIFATCGSCKYIMLFE